MLAFSSLLLLTVLPSAFSTTIPDIQGNAFRSPLVGKTVSNVTGVVTVKGPSGFWIVGASTGDDRVSNGLSIFSSSSTVLNKVAVGDFVSLGGKVTEFRSSSSPDDLSTTEIDSPTNIVVLSTGNPITPVVIGKDRLPPTQQFSSLDVGPDGFLSVPNNVSQIDNINPTLQPSLFGLDFWSSLEGQLVTIPQPVVTDFQNSFGEFWVYGDWPVTGKNSRGGVSITFGPDGIPDGNPETVIIGSPLDKTKNPSVSVGVATSDITGVVTYQFGFYYVLPLTAPTVISTPSTVIPATTLTSGGDACALTIGDYNVDNMGPSSGHLSTVANHIATFLQTPDIVFLQEIQDNSSDADDGTVSGNVTLSNLVKAIASASGGVTYDFLEIAPVNDQDGGVPGGNIRQAYLFRPERLSLVPGSPAGGSLDATQVITQDGELTLSFNPGRVDPTSTAWTSSRKPLAAAWQTASGARLFTVNLHLTSKDGSSSTQGSSRPPVNLGVEQRTSQVSEVATFVNTIFAADSAANVVVAGDCNEFLQTRSVYAAFDGILTDIDEVAGITPVERYTYVFDQTNEQLDHIFLSAALQARGAEVEHVHVNNWGPDINKRASDHDPSVGLIHVC